MKRKITYSTLLLFMFFSLNIQLFGQEMRQSKKTITISQNWQFKALNSAKWFPAEVPGTVHTDLLKNEEIEDPFYRLNELDLQWIDKKDWIYKTTFNLEQELLDKDKVIMVFHGLDTYSKVKLNDQFILESDNMFRIYKVDVKKYLREIENRLEIVFESPIRIGVTKYDNYPYKIPVSDNDQAETGKVEGNKKVSVFTRKAGYHFGWDWGPRLVSSGIWRPIEIQGWNNVSIQDVYLTQKMQSSNVLIETEVVLDATDSGKVNFSIEWDSEIIKTGELQIEEGSQHVLLPFEIENVELWWPNGLGDSKLYNFKLSIFDGRNKDVYETRIGIRSIELVREEDEYGKSFYFKVNGQPVFMKGANYIPQDVFLPRVDSSDYLHIINSAKEANMNMLRVWGGGIYENKLFYDLCDENGILVWQDFMFACAMFPGDSLFLENVRKEAVDNVKRLRNHASIALWCGNNEILAAWEGWGWKNQMAIEQGQEVADKIWKSYKDIFHTILPEVVEKYDPERSYWASSPSSDMGVKESQESGDMHYWGVWWGKEPFTKFQEIMPRFMSEFGFQSFPEFTSVKKYALPEDYNIYSKVMKSHQRSSIGNATIEEYMLRHYEKPKDFQSYLYISHLLQAYGIRSGIEAHRRNMDKCMGSLYWQINDCWPVASWSGIDYYGKWKALHYAVKRAFEPFLISISEERDEIVIHVVSDKLEDIECRLDLVWFNFVGEMVSYENKELLIPPNSSIEALRIKKDDLPFSVNRNEVILTATLISNPPEKYDRKVLATNSYFYENFKNLNLSKPTIDFSIRNADEKLELTLETDVFAKDVFLSINKLSNFSDNYFDLIPGIKKRIYIEKSDDLTKESLESEIEIISLYDAFN